MGPRNKGQSPGPLVQYEDIKQHSGHPGSSKHTEVIRPLATKLQKQDQDVYYTYQMVDDVRQRLEEIRTNVETEFSGWYEASQTMAQEVDSELT